MKHLFAALFIFFASPAVALTVDDVRLEDPALEARAEAISRTLRCMVCQNQSIEDSDAPLAQDLRRLVRERIVAGDSDEQVRAYMVERYGDFVLLQPPVKPTTLPLWIGPIIILVAGGGLVLVMMKKGKSA